MQYIKWIINNKYVQKWVQSKVSTKAWALVTAVVVALGLTTAPVSETITNTTTEGVTATIMENGGGAVKSLWKENEAEIDTGLVESEIEVASSEDYEYVLPANAPQWSDVKGNGVYKRERGQEHGTCVLESYDIMTIEAMYIQGLQPTSNGTDTFLDINHAYLNKRHQPGVNSGAVPDWIYEQYTTEGLPIRTTYQDTREDNWSFEKMKSLANEDAYNYTITPPFSKIASGRGVDTLMRDIDKYKAQGKDIVYRVSIKNHRNVAWYHETTPYIKDPVPLPSGGAHSLAGSGLYGVFEYKGEPTIYLHESSGSVRYHLARKSVLDMIMASWEIYEVNGRSVNADLLQSETISKGELGKSVTALQNYLISERNHIPAGATGYFGVQTQSALNQWQDKYFGDVYDGSVWNELSRSMYKVLQNK